MTLPAGVRSRIAGSPWPSYSIAALLAAAILFGGGGAEGPVNNGAIFAASAFALLGLVAAHWLGTRPLPDRAALPVWLLAGFLLIGLIQLVPLPPEVWRALPGRDLAESALRLVSADDRPRPHSLDPEATRRAMAALLLPAAMMLAVLGSGTREIRLLLRTIILCALTSSLIGAMQVVLRSPPILTFYEGPNVGAASGLFANANHQAALLLAAIVCLGLAIRLGQRDEEGAAAARRFALLWLLLPFFAVMTLATGSRAGSLLLILAVPASLIAGLGLRSTRVWAGALAGLVLLGLAYAMLSPDANHLAIGRGLLPGVDRRSAILPDALYTLGQFWPWGSGFGTFASAFAVNENLDVAAREFINHAHNDVLELVIEAGLPGAVWLAVAAAAIAFRAGASLFGKQSGAGPAASAWTGLVVLALFGFHSLVDYPLRTPSIAAVAGVAVGLIFLPLQEPATVQVVPRAKRWWALAACAIGGLVFGGQVLRMYVAQAAVRSGNGAAAAALRPQNGAGLALAAEEELLRRRIASARALAARAIVRSPASVRAVRVLATAEDLDRRGGMHAWRVASAMGWRDAPTQYWAMQQALANKEFETAAIRADALLRTAGRQLPERIPVVRAIATHDPFRKQLLGRLRRDPPWRPAFFNVTNSTPNLQLQGVLLVLRDSAAGRPGPTVEDAGNALRVLIQRKQSAQAIALYRSIAGPAAADRSMTDLRLGQQTESYIRQKNPFAWHFRNRTGSNASVEQSGNRRILLLGTNGRQKHQPVRRYAALGPGSYALGYSTRGATDSPETLAIAIYCADDGRLLAASSAAPLRTSRFERRRIRFNVPQSCPLLLLAFETKESLRPVEAEFTALSLEG